MEEKVEQLINIFSVVEDPRRETQNKLYPLAEILLVAFATFLCGGEDFVDMHAFGVAKLDFFKSIWPGGFKEGIATRYTFSRVFALLNAKQFEQCMLDLNDYTRLNYSDEMIAIDGKAVRGSRSKKNRAIQLVSAWACKNRVVLGCKAVDDKSNEITAIPEVLKMLFLKDVTVTIDAMGCQYEIARQIVSQEGNYVFALKGNQSALHDDVKTFFELNNSKENISYHEDQAEKDHGRIEKRKYGFSTDAGWLKQRHPNWETINGIGYVTSYRILDGKKTIETRYFLASKASDVKTFAIAVRAHWGIENGLHYLLDTAYHEDESQVRNKNAAHNLGILRRMVVNRINEKKHPKRSKSGMRRDAGWNNEYLKNLLSTV